jgi:RHS repeat-associated protein
VIRDPNGLVLEELAGDRASAVSTNVLVLGSLSTSTVDLYFDNLVWEAGETCELVRDPFEYLGPDYRIRALLPDGDGTYQQQQYGNWQSINERPQDDETTVIGFYYNNPYSATLHDLDEVETDTIDQIFGVIPFVNTGRWQAAWGYASMLVRTHDADYLTSSRGAGWNYTETKAGGGAHRAQSYITNPYTGEPWTVAEVNGLELGLKKTSGTKVGLTFAMVEVLYTVEEPELLLGFDLIEYEYNSPRPHAVTLVKRPEGDDAFGYDGAGNMTDRLEAEIDWDQAFNAEDRLTSISDGSDTWNFDYDGDGIRLVQENPDGTCSLFLAGGAYEVTLVADGSTSETVHYYAVGGVRVRRDSAGTEWYLTDHLGSVVTALDGTGAVTSQQRYEPFGALRYATGIGGTDFGYTGQRHIPAVGLMDYAARFYDSMIARFTFADTYIDNQIESQGRNRYAYVGNNPTN